MFKKSTKAVVEERVSEVYRMLLVGSSPSEIFHYSSEKGWDLTRRQIHNYIIKANKIFESEAITKRQQELGKAIARLNKLYQSNLKIQDYKAALQVQKEINSIIGLYAPTKSEHKFDDWRSQAIADIKAGNIAYDALVEAFDDSLAAQLFAAAGVSIQTGQD